MKSHYIVALFAVPFAFVSLDQASACGNGWGQTKCKAVLTIVPMNTPAPKKQVAAPQVVVKQPAVVIPAQKVFSGGIGQTGAGIVAGNTSRIISENGAGFRR